MKNQKLYESLLSVTKKSLEILSNSSDISITTIPESTWVKSSEDVFQKQSINKPYWPIILDKIEKEILNSKEYKDCLEVLKTDNIIKNQLNKLVGTYRCSSILQDRMIIFSPIYGLLNETNYLSYDKDNIFNKSTFDLKYSKIENFLYTTNFEFERITPLCGFHMDALEIQLDENIFIKKLTDKEILKFLNLGINLSGYLTLTEFHPISTKFAIKISYESPKIIGETDIKENQNPFDSGSYEKNVFNNLRIFKQGKVYPLSTLTVNKNSIHQEVFFNFGLQHKPFMFNKYQLTNNETDQFKEFWNSKNRISLPENHFLSVSIRRFSQANERDCIEDKIIDLLISAEALFLGSSGSFQGELKYRLSHRAAVFIETEREKQKSVFDFMQKAYDVRSAIVHGTTPKLPKKNDGSQYNLEDFSKAIEEYLRYSIKKIINLAAKSSNLNNIIDWDSVIFSLNNE